MYKILCILDKFIGFYLSFIIVKLFIPLLISNLTMLNSCINTPEESNFYLKLYYSNSESSKDSNWQNTTLIIKNRVIEYSVTHGGRNPRPDVKKEYKMTKEVEKKLIEYIKKHKLNQNIKESIGDISPGINISLSLEVKIEDITTKSDISGALNAWGSEEYLKKQKKKIIKNKDYYDEIHSLLVFLKFDLGFGEIEI
ncbi:MAG: hypothetical protein B6I20_12680 [Bacteroidetes bacterium 4572_117]|nr:MAG: hypothetical protein B6I20_12680 [Bacteroidetes bacterium 4572_117]